MSANIEKIRALIRSRKNIVVDQKFITDVLGFEDMRDFARELGDWGHVTDFTYRDYESSNWQPFLRRWLRETYLD